MQTRRDGDGRLNNSKRVAKRISETPANFHRDRCGTSTLFNTSEDRWNSFRDATENLTLCNLQIGTCSATPVFSTSEVRVKMLPLARHSSTSTEDPNRAVGKMRRRDEPRKDRRCKKFTPAAHELARASVVSTKTSVGVSVLSVETISFTPRPSRVDTGRLSRWASANQEKRIKPIRPTNGTGQRGIQVLTRSFQLIVNNGGSQQRFHPKERATPVSTETTLRSRVLSRGGNGHCLNRRYQGRRNV